MGTGTEGERKERGVKEKREKECGGKGGEGARTPQILTWINFNKMLSYCRETALQHAL